MVFRCWIFVLWFDLRFLLCVSATRNLPYFFFPHPTIPEYSAFSFALSDFYHVVYFNIFVLCFCNPQFVGLRIAEREIKLLYSVILHPAFL